MHLDDPVPSLKRGADRYRRPRQMRALFTSENREMKKARIPAAAAAGAALLLAQAAAARDLSRLSDRVLPVYIAQNIAAVCSVGNPGFAKDTGGPIGTIHRYAQHMKEELTARFRQRAPLQSCASLLARPATQCA